VTERADTTGVRIGARPTLFVTLEPLTERLAGPAIRVLELARQVAAGGAGPVVVATTRACTRQDPAVELRSADDRGLRSLVGDTVARGGCVVVQGDVLGVHPWLVDTDVPLVVDAYDPFHLEQLERSRALPWPQRLAASRDAVRSLAVQLSRADLVLCASDRQRSLWLGHLAALGRVNPATYDQSPELRGLLAVVPFGVPAEPPAVLPRADVEGWPEAVGDDHRVVLWAGGLYEWLDPRTVVQAMGLLEADVPGARLIFLGVQHPLGGGIGGETVADVARLAAELGLLDRTVFLRPGWVPYEKRGAWLSAADVAVSTHHQHVETEFSFRTRLLDSVWAGLPTVVTSGDDVGRLLVEAGAAREVPPGDPAALAAALTALLQDEESRRAAARATRPLAESLQWSRTARPLVDFCADPQRAPDLRLPPAEVAVLAPWSAGRPGRPSLVMRVVAALREGGPALLLRRARARLPVPRR
jgi:glycosyltransferase involved in cell wall biosynthesis